MFENINRTKKIKISSDSQSEIDDMQSTSTYKSVPVEVELGMRMFNQMKDQHKEPAIQVDVQKQPQTSGRSNVLVGVALHKPQHTVRRLVRYGIDEVISYALITINRDPENYTEAMKSEDHESWMQAMMEEVESLKKNQT